MASTSSTSVLVRERMTGEDGAMGRRATSWIPGDRLQEMILYLATRSARDPKFGKVKLQELMYYADFAAYRKLGRSISGADYFHAPNGPVLEDLDPAVTHMAAEGSVAVRYERRPPAVTYAEVVEPRRALRDILSQDERAIMDDVVRRYRSLSGSELSELVHKELGWRLTRNGEKIPYRTAWLSAKPLTDEQIETGKEIAARHGLLESTTP
jgi:uncharacterized phage-associated protein